jgi:DNA-binding LacI/PurR family transcriptional regulator
MQDVARLAEVSVMTVSNVVNGRNARVGMTTKRRVLAAIEQLGYRVNVPARQLRLGRTGIIGFAVPNLDTPYYGALAERLADRFERHGFNLVVERTGGAVEGELAALASSNLDSYDGLILAVARSEAADIEHRNPAKPIVLLGERAFGHRYDHVVMDNVNGARIAAEHLLRTGARRIALLGGDSGGHDTMPELRTSGYLEAHRIHQVPVVPELLLPMQFTTLQGYEAVRSLHDSSVEFDAVMAVTDIAAMGAMRALAELGRKVPTDVQVMGWDDLEQGRFAVPSLSTVEPANEEMADAVVQLLVKRITGVNTNREGTIVMPAANLVLRESTLPQS